MYLLALLSLTWAVEVIPVDLGPGGDLLTNAVTIEGNASLEVTADTCVMEFVVSTSPPKAGDAAAALKNARKSLETAVRTVIGASGKIEAGPPRISRKRREKERYFEARQTVTARITSFPKDDVEFNEFVARIAAGVAETGVVPDDLEYPRVTFEITRPGVFEERLASMAVADAAKRAETASKALKRALRLVRAGHFRGGVTAEGSFARFSNLPDPVTSDEMAAVITYTVLVVYDLEP